MTPGRKFAVATAAAFAWSVVVGAALGWADSAFRPDSIDTLASCAPLLVAPAAFYWASRSLFTSHPELSRAVLRGTVTVVASAFWLFPAAYIQLIAYLLCGGHE